MTKTALITGASIGIGLEFCKLFAQDGYDLVLVARSQEKLEKIAQDLAATYKINTHVIAKDLAKSGSAQELFDETQAKQLTIDVLVNNAGIGTNGKFTAVDLNAELNMIQLNVTSLVALCHHYGKVMSECKQGKILNIASTAAYQPGPFMANYYASKSYVLLFSEGLHEELKKDGVTVTTLCPGPTATEFFNAADMTSANLAKSPLIMPASKVAQIGYDALNKGKAVVVAGWINWLMAQSVRITPRFIIRKVTGLLNS